MQMQKCWLTNWTSFLNIESTYILKTSIAIERLERLLGNFPFLPILSHPVALLLNTDLHFRAET